MSGYLKALSKSYWGEGDEGWAKIIKFMQIEVPDLEMDFSMPDLSGEGSTSKKLAKIKVINLGPELNGFFMTPSDQVLLRDDYPILYSLIKERKLKFPRSGIVVTGQPGIGKTTFLLYLILALIMDGQTFALQWSSHFLYLVTGSDCVEMLAFNSLKAEASRYVGAVRLTR